MSLGELPANEFEIKLRNLTIKDNQKESIMASQEAKFQSFDDVSIESGKTTGNDKLLSACTQLIKDLNIYGMCVIDNFMGVTPGESIYQEVISLHSAGLFQDGQLVRNNSSNKDIRGDEILWLAGYENYCPNINHLIKEIDKIVMTSKKIPLNGKLGQHKIDGRTQAMVACYPGNGSHYVKHVDNSNGDGRVLTAIYYMNKNWDPQAHGGILRIFPNEERKDVANIEPTFDRMLFFWSDRRNPHEVQPAFRTRYAITIWYLNTGDFQRRNKIKTHPQFDVYSDCRKKCPYGLPMS